MSLSNPFLVDVDWLFAHLDDPNVSIVDGSWYLPDMKRDGRLEYEEQHIPGAVYFDINDVVEPGAGLPHTVASPDVFAAKAGALGISHEHTIVVYDGMGLFSAPRVWWNFRTMGVVKVVILDGGFPAWLEARLPVESGTAPTYPTLFVSNPTPNAVVWLKRMTKIVADETAQILDARPAGRFAGIDPEPRPGIRSGHMPGALSLPFPELAENGQLKSAEALKDALTQAGVDLQKPVVTTCGSGVTAAALVLALETVGHTDHALYDGSWAEWGSLPDTPVVSEPDIKNG
ncbi:MAG: 3-mercaptopyruvate sulfurtransferase [Pseudomonadota bacterium]